MSGLDPSGPSQPTLDQAYTTPGNPATTSNAENAQANINSKDDSAKVDQRIPTKQASEDQATASSLGRGIHGAPPGEEGKGLTEEDVGRHNELDGAQMAATGEGRVADAVSGRDGNHIGGAEPDLASDLDRKKAEQAEARETVKKQRAAGEEAGGVGQQGGPANPVGKNNYPN